MSLFKSQEFWATLCGKEENFDSGCMTTADILSEGFDSLVVGSHNGLLRVYQPQANDSESSNYKPTDLWIETQLSQPVIQVAVGKLISGSQNLQIGVLHPRSLAVYSLSSLSGSAQHGDQYDLVLLYEHQLSRSAYSMIVGPFGGVKNRDFICVQSLDGNLSFFEQETFAVTRSLTGFLLPSAIVYVPSSDSFIVLNANWILECYKYEVLADANRLLTPWWSLGLGEPLVGLEVAGGSVVALGERHLFCLREAGGLESVRRLQFTPCCLHVYRTEIEQKLMILVVADTATLLVYDLSTLCWSSQLPFVPVHLSRVNLKSVQGLIALLSDEGQLVCCYLGSEPAVFLAPPLPNKAQSYEDLQKKLHSTQQEIDYISQSASSGTQVSDGAGVGVGVTYRALALLDPCQCQLVVRLVPASALASVQLTVHPTPPIVASPPVFYLPSLCEPVEVRCMVSVNGAPVMTLDVQLVVGYENARRSAYNVTQVTASLPLSLALAPAPPSREAEHKVTLAVNHAAPPSLTQLFPDLSDDPEWEACGCGENAAALGHRMDPERPVTVVASRTSPPRYRLQSDDPAALCLVVVQLTGRLEVRLGEGVVSYQASLPLAPLLTAIDCHVELRNSINALHEKLGQQTTQYRAIQRRLLSKLREKTVVPLVGLDRILADTHRTIGRTSHAVQDVQAALERCSRELGCLVRLVLTLARLSDATRFEDWTDLAAAMSYVHHSSEKQGWEEVTERGVNYLLSTNLAKSVRDHQRTAVDPLKDSDRFKKHVTMALERIIAGAAKPRGVSPIMEGEEAVMSRRNSVSLNENQPSLPLLPVRKAMHSYDEPSTSKKSLEELKDQEATVW